jgi:hypothetical protein
MLKGQCHEIFCFWFFSSVSPQPQSIPLGPFRIFSKIRGGAGIVDTGGKFATGINSNCETGGKICHRCR